MSLAAIITIAVSVGVFLLSSAYSCWANDVPEPSQGRLKPTFMDYAKNYGGIIILCLLFSLSIAPVVSNVLLIADKGRIGDGTDVVESHEIVALKTSDDAESTTRGFAFVVFNSTTTHNDTYTVLTRGEDGGYSSFDFPASDTTLYEVKDDFRVEVEQAYVEYYSRFGARENYTEYRGNKSYKLFIPEGSLILNSYDAGWNK